MSRFMTTGQDWDTVTLNKKPAPKSGAALRIAPGDARFVSRGGPHVSSGGRTLNQQVCIELLFSCWSASCKINKTAHHWFHEPQKAR